ncbi:hypothetical protein ABB37_08152 [Leptomonas pyrrhocoris]|uniref:Uncharacterized protein n=1 Tax=Leptomonas pyrrhocoris TaxID=157538 RepID=A0A0M9FTX4_LEPPY|nr:hypothetical protein ABB37_08152 [Leptomonas pyrrhocoris]KPA76005.1 hypothetical protein ABB37_08152 [Leptomonas pyrrhocoris]|eukprot:XP_015654444.1 hypothetical protein ABB37_08152 [Leptomonas pyrrhocoris]
MSHPLLSDLARRISLHPGCRVELRHHWPAPHYHKTPQDVAEEAEEVQRRQAARASASTSASAPSPLHTTAAAAAAAAMASGANAGEPFNPFDHFRVRRSPVAARKSSRHHKNHGGSDAHHTKGTSTNRPSEPFSDASLAPAAAEARRRSRTGSGSGQCAATTASSATKKKKRKKGVAATEVCNPTSMSTTTLPPSPLVASAAAPSAVLATTTTTSSSGSPLSQQHGGQGGKSGQSPCSTSHHNSNGAPSSIKKRTAKEAHEEGLHGTPASTKALNRKKKLDASKPAQSSSANRSSSSSSSSSCVNDAHSSRTSSSNSNGSGDGYRDTRCDSDLDSDELVPCRDPLHVRLPRNPVHRATTSGVPRPLHVTVRWSGVLQRRRRYNRQLRKRLEVQEGMTALPLRQATVSSSCEEAAGSEASPTPGDPHPHTSSTACKLHFSARRTSRGETGGEGEEGGAEDDNLDSPDQRGRGNDERMQDDAATATAPALQPPSTVDAVSPSGRDGTSVEARPHQEHPQQRSATSQLSQKASDGHRDAKTGLGAGGTRSRADAHVGTHAPPPRAADDEESSYTTYTVPTTAAAQQQQQQYYARQPPCKSMTMFSQSTGTVPGRTSVLGMTYSDLPTPSSSADPCGATSSQRGHRRRHNSLLIIRSPPQDSNSETIMTAAGGTCYYYSRPGVYSRVNTGSGSTNLRVTYVTNNNNGSSSINTGTAEGAANSQQQQQQPLPRLRGLAHVPRPRALTISAQGYTEMGSHGQIRSSSGSPTTVVVPDSSTYGGVPGANFSATTPPGSLPSTPLQISPGQGVSVYTHNTNSSNNVSSAAGVRGAAPTVVSPAGRQSPPPLTMKTVMRQRRRSSLLRQQQLQQRAQQQRQQKQESPFLSFFPSPEAVAAHMLAKKSSSTTTGGRVTPPQQPRAQSTAASSTAGTVAFSPLNVHVAANTHSSSPSPRPSRGPLSVDVLEGSPLPCDSVQHDKSSPPSEGNADRSRLTDPLSARLTKSYSNVTLHEDPMLLSGPAVHNYLAMHPQRDRSWLSTLDRSSSLQLMRVSQPYTSHPDVPSLAPYGATGGRGGSPSATANVPYGGGQGDESVSGGGGTNYLNYTSGNPSATPQPYGATFRSPSFPATMWVGTGDTEAHDSSLQQQQPCMHPQQHQPGSPLGVWAYNARPCFCTPSVSSAWVEQTGLGATTTAHAGRTPMMPHPGSYLGFTTNNLSSEPATPMFFPQQQRLRSLSPQQQQPGASYSAMSTPHLTQLPPPFLPSCSSSPGTVAAYGAARRSNSLLQSLPFPTSPHSPHVPEIFCKLQRSDRQRLRRRGPVLPPGTKCPGMAGRLAYDAYREAVRRGLVTEEEECSYYLSHHRYSATAPSAGKKEESLTSSTTSSPQPRSPRRVSESSPSPPAAQRSRHHSLLAPAARPLCVVSLADLRTTSPTRQSKRKNKKHSDNNAAQTTNATATAASGSVDASDSDEQRSSSRSSSGSPVWHGSDLDGSWSSPRFLYHIPRCGDDPYHRDEEALEMISVTTASSCAFGAGLEGLSWREWMPSSPLEAREEVLRSLAATSASSSATTAHTLHNSSHASAGMAAGSAHGAQLTSTMGGSFSRRLSRTQGGFSGSTSFIVPPAAAVVAAAASSFCAAPAPTSPDMAAPRNADDIELTHTTDNNNNGQPLPPQQRTQTGASSGNAGGDRSTPTAGSKRPFIAEWIVSKLQKHIEKKRQKKLLKQKKREVAAMGGGGAGAVLPLHAEEHPPLPRDAAHARGESGALRARSATSSLSEHTEASSPLSGSLALQHRHNTPSTPETIALEQLHRRTAYLAAAYQTELVIYEQKRRELLANRGDISALVERSRSRMTPEAAAAGYFYEAQGGGGGVGGGHGDAPHRLVRPLHSPEKDAVYPRITTSSSSSPPFAAKVAATARLEDAAEKENKETQKGPRGRKGGVRYGSGGAAGIGNSASSSSTTTYSTSSGSSSGYLQAVVSVASPVRTEIPSANAPSKPPPVARMTAKRGEHTAVVALENRNVAPLQDQQKQKQPQKQSKGALTSAEQRKTSMPLQERRPQTKTQHPRAGAEKAETEQMRVALDTVRMKQKSIESWIHAIRRQW